MRPPNVPPYIARMTTDELEAALAANPGPVTFINLQTALGFLESLCRRDLVRPLEAQTVRGVAP